MDKKEQIEIAKVMLAKYGFMHGRLSDVVNRYDIYREEGYSPIVSATLAESFVMYGEHSVRSIKQQLENLEGKVK